MLNPDPRLIELLNTTVQSGSSDLHLTAGRPPSMRRDGVLLPVSGIPNLTPEDTGRITQFVTADIQEAAPGLLGGAGAGTKSVQIIVTRYDAGSAGARLMLAGLGQIRLDADVLVVDRATGQKAAEYKVSKQFAFGGIYGAVTSIQDVEKGFSRSVAALFKPGG